MTAMWPVTWGNNVTQSVYSERWQEGIEKILTKDRKDLERTHAIVTRNLKTLNTPGKYYNFSDFLIEHWLTDKERQEYKEEPEEKETYREIAYKHCHDKVQKSGAVSRPTLRHWFGFGKADTNKSPRRSQIIAFAFATDLSQQEMEEYLVEGMLEPELQVNDYTEIIYDYGLRHHLKYDTCNDMILLFEREVNKDIVIAQRTHTAELTREYHLVWDKSKEEFLVWMCKNASYFKGYSKVALNWFVKLKHEILDYIRQDSAHLLAEALDHTKYSTWEKENRMEGEKEGDAILRFLHNVSRRVGDTSISEALKKEITYFVWVVYGSRDQNRDLLAEIYSSAVGQNGRIENHKKFRNKKVSLPESVYLMTDKYLSQLIGVAVNKEKDIRLSQALHCLENEKDQEPCPDWIVKCLAEYRIAPADATIAKARKEIEKELKKQKHRWRRVSRSDLLPLIHYVAQKRYAKQIMKDENYDQEEACRFFEEFANEVFSDCHMAPLNEKYQLDCFFLLLFDQENMYTLSELIEVVKQEE